ncbi:coiled-coil domain-containing protein 8 [Microcebus murinus]|uniref:coiled-coil domain-containing protein 8 n=1 Tax=Microcebus murinus TaxID=30608 RepID=UPI0006429B88|nr:coiled-coil domain-containing protein 8 [Microcebus murinus]
MLQIGEDVDYLLIPREVRLAGGVWRVISKPATKEAEFRERLIQFLEEEGRTLEDVARIIEKSTPHPPQPPRKPKEPQARRRVQQMVTPPPRLVVGTYDSSNASDSEFSDFETSRDKGNKGSRPGKKVRKMPVSYLGSKFLGSDLESEDDEELVEAFLRRGEKKPSAPPARRRVNLPVPMFEDNLGPQVSKADRWREYVSQVSWGKLKRRVKGWAPRSGQGTGGAQQASTAGESNGASPLASTSRGDNVGHAADGRVPETSPRGWRPKINWASFRRRRKEEAAAAAQGADSPEEQGAPAADNQGAEAVGDQREGAPAVQGAEAADDQRGQAGADQADPGAEAPNAQGAESAQNGGAASLGAQEVEASAAQGAPGPTPGARARKQVKTVRFQTPGRFSWFRKRRRAFWHTARLPTLPKRVPRAGEARSLRVLRAEARAQVEQEEEGEREDQL